MGSHKDKLIALYDLFPFIEHPLWNAVRKKELSVEQIFLAEGQHYLRTKAGQVLRKDAMEKCLSLSTELWEAIIDTYLEECTEDDGTPTHLDLIKNLLFEGGYNEKKLLTLKNTPGNIAAIALYKDVSERGAGCHLIGAGIVELFYSRLCPQIYSSYTKDYKLSHKAAETYAIHGPMDQVHAERAMDVIEEAVRIHGWSLIENSVRDAFVATSLHYDGMLQAATGENKFWNGKK